MLLNVIVKARKSFLKRNIRFQFCYDPIKRQTEMAIVFDLERIFLRCTRKCCQNS